MPTFKLKTEQLPTLFLAQRREKSKCSSWWYQQKKFDLRADKIDFCENWTKPEKILQLSPCWLTFAHELFFYFSSEPLDFTKLGEGWSNGWRNLWWALKQLPVTTKLSQSVTKRIQQLHKMHSGWVCCLLENPKIESKISFQFKAVQVASKSLMEAITEVYEPQWSGSEALYAQSSSIEVLWQDFSHKLGDQVLIPLNTYTAQFPEMRVRRGLKLENNSSDNLILFIFCRKKLTSAGEN